MADQKGRTSLYICKQKYIRYSDMKSLYFKWDFHRARSLLKRHKQEANVKCVGRNPNLNIKSPGK